VLLTVEFLIAKVVVIVINSFEHEPVNFHAVWFDWFQALGEVIVVAEK